MAGSVVARPLFADLYHVNESTGPAPRKADLKLFNGMDPFLKALQKQSRAGLRLNARAVFWQQKQAQQQQQQTPHPQ